MTRDELVAAYRFAGVPDPAGVADAFIAAITSPLAVPFCPACGAPAAQVVWLGGAPPHGDDDWRCVKCQHRWTTPPAGSKP